MLVPLIKATLIPLSRPHNRHASMRKNTDDATLPITLCHRELAEDGCGDPAQRRTGLRALRTRQRSFAKHILISVRESAVKRPKPPRFADQAKHPPIRGAAVCWKISADKRFKTSDFRSQTLPSQSLEYYFTVSALLWAGWPHPAVHALAADRKQPSNV